MPGPSSVYLFSNMFWLVAIAFWLWMLVDCILHDRDRYVWLWLILFLNLPGALLYFFIAYVPRLKAAPPRALGRWLRRRELQLAESDVRTIGNPKHFVALADLLCETGQGDKAAEAYEQALDKDGANVQALWGIARLETRRGRLEPAQGHLRVLLDIDPDYKFGEASVAYGQILLELGEVAVAREHVRRHLEHRVDPEAKILLATILVQEGEMDEARALLEPLAEDLKGSRGTVSRYSARKARALLRRVGG